MLGSVVRHPHHGHGGAYSPLLLHLVKEHPHQGHPARHIRLALHLVHFCHAQATEDPHQAQLEHKGEGANGGDQQVGHVQGVQHVVAKLKIKHLTYLQSHIVTSHVLYHIILSCIMYCIKIETQNKNSQRNAVFAFCHNPSISIRKCEKQSLYYPIKNQKIISLSITLGSININSI